jgi:eukaryotic-like serine/threonine-protein kinase
MDFGIARAGEDRGLTMTGTTLGSLGYMSPEQVKGEPTDARSDLYSVGVSLYEMVTGQRPFRADSDYSLMTAHVRETPKPPIELQPGLPAALNEIILMAISKDPGQRFQSADAFGNAVSSVGAAASQQQNAAVKASDAATAEYAVATSAPTPTPTATPSRPAPSPIVAPASAKTPTPAPPPVPAMPPPASSGHRGLYMTLGALIVLVVLVLGGIYLPRSSKTEARQGETNQSPAQQGDAQPLVPASATPDGAQSAMPQGTEPAVAVPTPPPTSAPQPSPPPITPAVENSNLTPGKPARPVPHTYKVGSQGVIPEQQPGSTAQSTEAQAAPADTANPVNQDDVEKQIDQLSNRAAAVNSSLDRLQQQQANAGYGLRGDMAAKQASMKNNLSKAESAAERGDLARAKKYADMAATDVEALEHFLGH